jgi:cytochrome c oxidase subunit 2
MAVIAGFTVPAVMALAKTDDTQCVVNVTGQQWWWEYDYPVTEDGTICGVTPTSGVASPIITSGQLVIPTGTKVLVRGTSRDVIHSFWIPRLNGKKDIVPGRVHYLRMEADEPGIYAGQCTEFCGLSHANMRMEAVALDPADFQRLGRQPARGRTRHQRKAPRRPKAKRCSSSSAHAVTRSTGSSTTRPTTTRANDALVVSAPDEFVFSGAAPNLTNLMTRNTFAGAMFDLLTEECRDDVWNAPVGGVRREVSRGRHPGMPQRGRSARVDP